MEYFVRYGEIGIKSPKIRHKFEKRLMDNITIYSRFFYFLLIFYSKA